MIQVSEIASGMKQCSTFESCCRRHNQNASHEQITVIMRRRHWSKQHEEQTALAVRLWNDFDMNAFLVIPKRSVVM
jgi:hypothetical protein